MEINRLRRTLSRRRLLVAGLAGAGVVAAAGTGMLELLHDGKRSPEAVAPAASPSVVAATPPGPLSFLEPSSGAFERVEFALTDTIDWASGVFYMNTATGAMTAYRSRKSSPDAAVQVAPLGPRFVFAEGAPDNSSALLDRTTGAEWRWDARRWRVLAGTESFLVFAESQDNKDVGRYVIARADLKSAVEYRTGASTWTRWLVQGEVAAVTSQLEPGRVELVDLATGSARIAIVAPPGNDGRRPWGTQVEPDTDAAFTALVTYQEGEPNTGRGPGSAPPEYVLQRISWKGVPLATVTGPDWFESASPDGKHRVRETQLHTKPSVGLGSGETWPATVLLDADGTERLRVRSASLNYGDSLPRNRWLADSAAFVAMVRDPESPRTAVAPFRYALISPNGKIELLPNPPLMVDDWFTRPNVRGPVPSPTDPDLLSFGRFYLHNRRTGDWFVPKLTDRNGPAHWFGHGSPWEAGAKEMVFSLGHGGHDGNSGGALISPLIERSPFAADPPMRFLVEGTGSCLNLREKPDEGARILSCLADGTRVQLDPNGEILWEGAQQGYSYATSSSGHVLVNAPGGLRGWAASAYLRWDAGG